jgi:phospholipase C
LCPREGPAYQGRTHDQTTIDNAGDGGERDDRERAGSRRRGIRHAGAPNGPRTTTPTKHLVVIFQENVTFDHYFGTYPKASNTDGHPFMAKAGTPTVNGLSKALLLVNPNGVNPQRLGASDALTCDQNHAYTAEQQAADKGLVDQFPTYTQVASCSPPDHSIPGLVMDYYDGTR